MDRYKYAYGKGLLPSPYDPRDYKFADLVCGAMLEDIPETYITQEAPFTYNQGNSSMCCASAYSYIRYLQESDIRQSELSEPFSPTFIYGNRDYEHDYCGEGMYLRDCCKKGKDGMVLYKELPYPMTYKQSVQVFQERKDELLEKAKPFGDVSFYVCSKRKEIQRAIMDCKAVLIGIPVFDCFYRPDDLGFVHYDPKKDVESDGGHAIVVIGWLTTDDGFYWVIKNSWGEDWGINGCCFLPESYPWMDQAYAIVDEKTEMKFNEYKARFYAE